MKRRRSPGRVLGLTGGVLLAVLLLAAVLAPVLSWHPPDAPSGPPFQPPTADHPLGTNDAGEDLWAQLLDGARVSLLIAVIAALVATALGSTVALVAGHYRGRVEAVLMRTVDLMLGLPFLVLVIVLATFFGRGLVATILVISVVIWARPARVLRSQVLKAQEAGHVLAARSMGASPARVIGRHVLPRIAPLAAAQFVRAANIAVLLEASLAFLGLGDPVRVSWGTILHFANARNAFLTDAWAWWVLPPGLALTTAVVGFAFLGYAVEEWADPRLTRPARRPPRRPGAAPEITDPDGPALRVRDLVVQYETASGPARAVDGVDFDVPPGRVVGLVGESGSGKSTLAMALLGLTRPPARVTDGQVWLGGRDLGRALRSRIAPLRGRGVALIPQIAMNALNPAYSAHRQVAEAAALTRPGAAAAARASELLELVGIPVRRHHAFPHELSGGMRQRIVIAMAVANEPSLLIADEPVTGLDVITQARIVDLLLDLRTRMGMSILLISHDLPLAATASDDLLVMYAGRIVEDGPSARVTAEPGHPYTRELLRGFPSLRGPREPLVAINGDPPDPLAPPAGCRFHPRCPSRFGACDDVDPRLVELGGEQSAACLLHQDSPSAVAG
ncbi:dipeptide/oligopeptide/nickel ABC transporter permease/ATP-binding protein [Pseudonocardia kunmingensis]|uniref:Oligopeptide/dipeptide ABC transporter ATP-binding protein n=1 Tax=Pseudonocardia kunmingensis TaxID=630975 RepID=A0A543DP57_9PSEU|nr:dipeptide/oligopeptide/nickel ABC transporter permease/ATP-binding protein [Pseudonocardia kunmingensis]TQM11117.1 oligopeptide/dipeptide ABC transporter ATP-binding protein [Pseudonocardia kunmingensis]